MGTKWLGAAAWSAQEAHAGDRLPYARLVDEQTLLLREGSLMAALQVPGLLFETEDSDALNHHAATREVMLRSTLDARFVLYHHVIRRRVTVELAAEFDDPLAAHIDAKWKERLAGGSLFVNDQFVTLIRRPARGKAGLAEKASKLLCGGATGSSPIPRTCAPCGPRSRRSPPRSATTARSRSAITSARAAIPTTSCSSS